MKALQFGIATIVDTNTGYGLPHRADVIDYATADDRARELRASSFRNYLHRVRSGVSAALNVMRKRRELKRSLRQLSALNDYLLEDIGLTRGDIMAAENGYLDRAELESLRTQNHDNIRIPRLNLVEVEVNESRQTAANESIYTPAKCA
jgi:uncharacterized protein YjiS (DUF1127 family)